MLSPPTSSYHVFTVTQRRTFLAMMSPSEILLYNCSVIPEAEREPDAAAFAGPFRSDKLVHLESLAQ
jgi:hypothetical protein